MEGKQRSRYLEVTFKDWGCLRPHTALFALEILIEKHELFNVPAIALLFFFIRVVSYSLCTFTYIFTFDSRRFQSSACLSPAAILSKPHLLLVRDACMKQLVTNVLQTMRKSRVLTNNLTRALQKGFEVEMEEIWRRKDLERAQTFKWNKKRAPYTLNITQKSESYSSASNLPCESAAARVFNLFWLRHSKSWTSFCSRAWASLTCYKSCSVGTRMRT